MADDVTIKGLEFEVKGNADRATDSLKKLRESLSSLKGVAGGGLGLKQITTELKAFSQSLDNLTKDGKLKAFGETVKEVSKIKAGSGLTNSLTKLSAAVQGFDVAKLNAVTNMFRNAGGGIDFTVKGIGGFTKFLETVDTKSAAVWEVTEYLNNLAGLDFSNLADAAKSIKDIASASGSLHSENPEPVVNDKQTEATADETSAVARALDEAAASAGEFGSITSIVGEFGSRFSAAASAIKGFTSRVKDAVVAVAKLAARAGSAIGKVAALPFKKAAENAKNFAQKLASVGSSFKRILFYRAIRTLIKEIGQAFKDGTNSLYAWSSALGGEFASSMDSIATSFAYFKNSVGAAVAPLINALAPAIEFVIEKAVALLNVINQLFARLSGATYWTKATRQATAYGDAASGAGGAAKEAMKYLAPFDELNVLPDNSSGGGGGGGGGAGGSGLFEEVVEFGDAIEELGELFDEGKFFEAGQLLAEKFGEIVDYLDEKINSEEFRSKLLGALSKVTDIINGFFDGITFSENGKSTIAERLGDLVGDAIGLFLESLHTWYSGIDWSQIGVAIAQFVNGGIESLKEQPFSLGDVLADWINSKIDLISGFANTVKWSEIGSWIAENINDAISGIDWSKAGETLIQVITGLADIVLAAVYGLDADTIGSAIGDFLSSAVSKAQEWLTETPFREIGNKVGELLTSAVSNINDVLEQSSLGTIGSTIARFINGVLERTDWTEIGALPVNIFTGLLDNIIGFIEELDWGQVTYSIGEFLAGAIEAFAEWKQNVDWSKLGRAIVDGIIDAIDGMVNSAGDILNAIVDLISASLGATISFAAGVFTGLADRIWDGITSAFKNDSGEKPKNIWEALLNAMEAALTGAVNIATWAKEHVVDPFMNALVGKTAWANMESNLNDWWTLFKSWMNDYFVRGFQQLGIDAANALIGKVEDALNGIVSGYNWLADKFGWEKMDPIKLTVIPDLQPPVGTFYEQTKQDIQNRKAIEMSVTTKMTTTTDVSYDTIIQEAPTTIEIPVRPSFGFTSFAEVAQQENKIGTADLPVGYKTNWANPNSTIGTDLTKRGMVGEVSVAATYRNNWQYSNSTIGTDLTKRGMAGNATVSVGYQSNWQYPNNSIGVSMQKRGWVGSASLPIGYYSNWTHPNSTVASSMYQRGWIGSTSIGVDYTRNWTYSGSTIAKDLVAKGWAGTIYIPVKYSTTSNVPMAAASGGLFSGGKWHPIEQFASGGFPGGQMFIAREAGPELVGTLKGHTAVMNNDQIVASVSAGVARAISDIQFRMTGFPMMMPTYSEDEDTEEAMYRAFMRALSTIDLSTDDHINIDVDGDTLYQGVVRRNRQNTRMTGMNALT